MKKQFHKDPGPAKPAESEETVGAPTIEENGGDEGGDDED